MNVTRIFILSIFVLCIGSHAVYAADDPAVSKKELQRIKREMQEKKKEIKRAYRKERSILSDLEKTDREIQTGKTELAEHQKRLRDAESSLYDVEKRNAAISSELIGLKRLYAQRVRALYKMSRNGYATALFTTDAQGNALKRIKYLAMIAEQDRRVIRDYGTAISSLSLKQIEMSQKKELLLERKRVIEVKKAELEARKRKKADILANVREEKSLSEQAFRELEESSTNLWAMVKKAEQERKAVKQASAPRSTINPSQQDKKSLSWPVEGRVLTRFGMQRHPEFKTMVFRRGIEIEAREGQAVRSVNDGQVAYSDWYKGYGKLMIVEHEPGFYTLYGNLSQLNLNKGDPVVKGQVIGLAGETGSLKGSKLYFEVRLNGEAQDPLSLLVKR